MPPSSFKPLSDWVEQQVLDKYLYDHGHEDAGKIVCKDALIGGERPTGGALLRADGRYAVSRGPVELGMGVGFGLFGLGEDDPKNIGLLGGPSLQATFGPEAWPAKIGLSLAFDFGRIPVCNDWGLCLRWQGFFPAACVVGRGGPEIGPAFVAGACSRRVSTDAWSGFSRELFAGGRFRW